MNPPVYSVDAQCRDCYKCVRHCPVKSIVVENDHATVKPQTCILCGRCVSVCAHAAKQVRDDLPRARALLRQRRPVYASLAPSFVAEFPGVRPAQLVTALHRLGFASVHETAEGAELVSREVAALLDRSSSGLLLSTACPVAVELVTRYHPGFAAFLTPIQPPLLVHAAQLQSRYGAQAPVIFFGPCIGKKRDADQFPEVLHTALTFEELRRWLTVTGIDPSDMPDDASCGRPGHGARYALEGGMNQTIRRFLKRRDLDDSLLTVSGLERIDTLLRSLAPQSEGPPLFLELLACEGGCVAGPKLTDRNAVAAQLDVLAYARRAEDRELAPVSVVREWPAEPVSLPDFPEASLAATLHSLGKYQPEDELNCGGCGYDSCRALAGAVLRGAAEMQMCVSHMRQLAQKKTHALSRALPYGLVLADAHLRIIECNERFAHLFGETLVTAYEVRPGLRDADLTRILPFSRLFKAVLDSGHEIVRKSVQLDGKIFSMTVFDVEPHAVVGALLLDVTETEQRRLQIIQKSRTVIQNTTKTVQEIAYMLGKNSAQSELILNSVIDMFAAEDPEDPEGKS